MARPTNFTPELGDVTIYALCEPCTGKVRYIGKANNPRKRYASHLKDSRHKNTPVYSWIRKLMSHNKLPVMITLEIVEAENWPEAERRLISQYRKAGGLLNVADGGNEPYCSAEVRGMNGRANSKLRDATPRKKRLNFLRQQLGIALKQGHVNDKTKARMRELAMKRPDLFGKWAMI